MDVEALFRALARAILAQDGRIDGDTRAFVRRFLATYSPAASQPPPDAEALLTDWLDSVESSLRGGIEQAIGIGAQAGVLTDAAVAAQAAEAWSRTWEDGKNLSQRLWRFNAETRAGITRALQDGIRQMQGVGQTLYALQRAIEGAHGGERFTIIERQADDWVGELYHSAQTLIHDPEAKQQWAKAVAEARQHIESLKTTGTRHAAERVLDQIRKAVAKGNADLVDNAVKWWVYDKQLYHLKRISRTEMATAGHNAIIASTAQDGNIIGYQWRLSASHPAPDICDYYASVDFGLGRGVFPKDQVPKHKAHPHCLCLIVPRVTKVKQRGETNYAAFIQHLAPEKRAALLPPWARGALAAGTPLEKLIRPDGFGLVSKAEAEGAKLIRMERNVYEIAKAGGDYSKFFERYKDVYLSRLKRALRSYEKVIAEHEDWIKNPAGKLGSDASEDVVKRYVEGKWPRDIARNAAYKAIIEGIIEERKNGRSD